MSDRLFVSRVENTIFLEERLSGCCFGATGVN